MITVIYSSVHIALIRSEKFTVETEKETVPDPAQSLKSISPEEAGWGRQGEQGKNVPFVQVSDG